MRKSPTPSTTPSIILSVFDRPPPPVVVVVVLPAVKTVGSTFGDTECEKFDANGWVGDIEPDMPELGMFDGRGWLGDMEPDIIDVEKSGERGWLGVINVVSGLPETLLDRVLPVLPGVGKVVCV